MTQLTASEAIAQNAADAVRAARTEETEPSVSVEIDKVAIEAVQEAQLLGELVSGIQTQIDSLLGNAASPSPKGDPEACPDNALARLRIAIRQIGAYRSRLETCSNRL